MTYWEEAERAWGLYACWQLLKEVNGYPERALPIGDLLRFPDACEIPGAR